MKTPLTLALIGMTLSLTQTAQAQFADPPDQPLIARNPEDPPPDRVSYYEDPAFYHPRSTVRLHTGPALRISDRAPDGGLFAALDIGERAAGLRLSGAWVRVGGSSGMSQYGGELWIDFGHDKRLHPVLGAGAGVARVTARDRFGEDQMYTVGVGTLRAGLAYLLPIRDTDARASVEAMGSVPAIRGEDDVDFPPWLLVVATVGVGF